MKSTPIREVWKRLVAVAQELGYRVERAADETGLSHHGTKRITVGDWGTLARDTAVLAHEIGHSLQYTQGSEEERRLMSAARLRHYFGAADEIIPYERDATMRGLRLMRSLGASRRALRTAVRTLHRAYNTFVEAL